MTDVPPITEGKSVRVRMLIGALAEDLERPEPITPLVAGCMDMGTWEVVDPEESDAAFAAMRRYYEPEYGMYAWREVVVTIDADTLADLFQTQEIVGEVESA